MGTEVSPQTPATVLGGPGTQPVGLMAGRTGEGVIGNSICVPRRWTLNTAMEDGMRSGQLGRTKVRQWEEWPVREHYRVDSTALEVGDVGQLLEGMSREQLEFNPHRAC